MLALFQAIKSIFYIYFLLLFNRHNNLEKQILLLNPFLSDEERDAHAEERVK